MKEAFKEFKFNIGDIIQLKVGSYPAMILQRDLVETASGYSHRYFVRGFDFHKEWYEIEIEKVDIPIKM